MTVPRHKRKFINGVRQLDHDALRLWGKLREFERQSDAACDPARMFQEMTETMKRDTLRLLPEFVSYWRRFAEAVKNPPPPRGDAQ